MAASPPFDASGPIRRLLALPVAERRLVCTAAAIVVLVRASLWALPSRAILRTARRLATRTTAMAASPVAARRIVWAVEAVSRRVPGATCLTQALSAQLLLSRHGHPAELCLGVARGPGGGFRAHAWLERDGSILIGGPDATTYVRLPSIAESRGLAALREGR